MVSDSDSQEGGSEMILFFHEIRSAEIEEILAQARGKKFQQEMLDFLEQDEYLQRVDGIFSAELEHLKSLPCLNSSGVQDAINAVSDGALELCKAHHSEPGAARLPLVVFCTMLVGIDRFVQGMMDEEESRSYRKYIDQFKESERPKLRVFCERLAKVIFVSSVVLMGASLLVPPLLLMSVSGFTVSGFAYLALVAGSCVGSCLVAAFASACFNKEKERRSYLLLGHATNRLFNKVPKNEVVNSTPLESPAEFAIA
ncbi:MAG: hypothetical protein A3F41_04100 [Coxiella sp. RIFCSPHIGHO2_12_FULL_44_14]|nr:MAG: hypothetical protein A3F41_04100 [Coxiella sp. RIFCSPHIGHO2_12_FULL_44_14]